jgi:RimJ/RimL family protein N-acetyltransferase
MGADRRRLVDARAAGIGDPARIVPLGSVGAFYRESALGRLDTSDLEVGWNVFRPHWRNGYATEAARAALDWALGTQRPPRVIAYIDKENVASVRVAEAIGLRFTEDAMFYGEPIGLWSKRRAEA